MQAFSTQRRSGESVYTEIRNRFSCTRSKLNHTKDSFLLFSNARFFFSQNLTPAENYAIALISSFDRFNLPLQISRTANEEAFAFQASSNAEQRRITHPHAATYIASLSAAGTVPGTNRGVELGTRKLEPQKKSREVDKRALTDRHD